MYGAYNFGHQKQVFKNRFQLTNLHNRHFFKLVSRRSHLSTRVKVGGVTVDSVGKKAKKSCSTMFKTGPPWVHTTGCQAKIEEEGPSSRNFLLNFSADLFTSRSLDSRNFEDDFPSPSNDKKPTADNEYSNVRYKSDMSIDKNENEEEE